MITDERLDELIFDYLEGNLSAEEREAFEILKAENEMFNAQVLQWKNTYVSEPLPPIGKLQQKLLIPSGNSGTSRMLFSLSLLLLLIFLPGDNFDGIRQSAAKLSNVNNGDDIVSAVPLEVNIPVSACESPENNFESAEEKSGPSGMTDGIVPAVRSGTGEAAYAETLIDKPLLPDLGVEMSDIRQIEIRRVANPPVSTVEAVEMKKLSKKQMRALRAHKRKSNRRALGFQSGDVPYVVPLNKNF